MSPGAPDNKAVRAALAESARAIGTLDRDIERIQAIGGAAARVLRTGGKILTAGNGGSAAEALHLAEELMGRFRGNRPSLAAVALVADPTLLTCIANDFGFDEVFRRQVQGLGRPGDMLVLFSTSGKAANLRLALEAAREKGLVTVCLLGRDGGPLAGRADHEIIVQSDDTARIQEAHQVIVHLLLEIVEAGGHGDSTG
jgi:D-sedoheptulose 7-phosphate isomerase